MKKNSSDLPETISLESANRQLQNVFAPWVSDLSIRLESINNETVVMRLPYSDRLCRSGSIICGQALMSLIDTCMVFVCYAGLNRFANVTTVSQNTSFLRPAMNTNVLATGTVIKAGRSLVFGEVSLTGERDGKRVSSGTSTYAVIPDLPG